MNCRRASLRRSSIATALRSDLSAPRCDPSVTYLTKTDLYIKIYEVRKSNFFGSEKSSLTRTVTMFASRPPAPLCEQLARAFWLSLVARGWIISITVSNPRHSRPHGKRQLEWEHDGMNNVITTRRPMPANGLDKYTQSGTKRFVP